MDSSKSEIHTSMAEYLEKEKLCEEICETITKSVEESQLKPNCAFPSNASSLLPELNSDDDVEDILQQISDLLGSQLGDSSQCTEIDANDDLSVDEILKQAEQIVRASTPYFERKTCTGVEPLLEPIRKNVKHLATQSLPKVPHNDDQRNASSHTAPECPINPESSCTYIQIANIPSDKSAKSSTSSNDSDDELFESPSESPNIRSPHRNTSSPLRKSCSDTNCNLKIAHEVKKSSSAGRCDLRNVPSENVHSTGLKSIPQNQDSENGEENNKELTVSDLAVPSTSSILQKDILDVRRCAVTNEELPSHQQTIATDHIPIEQNSRQREATTPPLYNPSSSNNNKPEELSISKKDGKLFAAQTRILTNLVTKIPKKSQFSTKSDKSIPVRKSEDGVSQPASVFIKQPIEDINKSNKKFSSNTKTALKNNKDEPEKKCTNQEHCGVIVELQSQIKLLSSKIVDYQKLEERARKNETLANAERQRFKVLQEEILSQEELIVGYQKENQRLSNDVLSAKVIDNLLDGVRWTDDKLCVESLDNL